MVLTASPTGIDYDLDVDANMVNDFKVNMIGDISNGYGNFVAGSFSSMNGALKEAVWGDAMHLSVGDSINASALTWTDFTSDLPVTIFVGGASYGQEWHTAYLPIEVDNLTELNSAHSNDGLLVFPNPSSGIANLENLNGNVITVSVHTMDGRLVKQWSSSAIRIEINLSDHPRSAYVLQIQKNNGDVKRQLLIVQ